MVVNLKDNAIIKKYSTQIEFVQAQYTHPANSTLAVTYSPPAGMVFIPIFGSSGSQIFKYGKVTSYIDGTIFYNEITSSIWMENIMPIGGMWIIREIISYSIVNTDTNAHDIDFVLAGVLIPRNMEEAFVAEISGETDRKVNEEILKSLHRLESLIAKPTPMRR